MLKTLNIVTVLLSLTLYLSSAAASSALSSDLYIKNRKNCEQSTSYIVGGNYKKTFNVILVSKLGESSRGQVTLLVEHNAQEAFYIRSADDYYLRQYEGVRFDSGVVGDLSTVEDRKHYRELIHFGFCVSRLYYSQDFSAMGDWPSARNGDISLIKVVDKNIYIFN